MQPIPVLSSQELLVSLFKGFAMYVTMLLQTPAFYVLAALLLLAAWFGGSKKVLRRQGW